MDFFLSSFRQDDIRKIPPFINFRTRNKGSTLDYKYTRTDLGCQADNRPEVSKANSILHIQLEEEKDQVVLYESLMAYVGVIAESTEQ